ncbi:hypothetical protein CHELA40_12203 [Chelatococcus asaccharovorans]|nr:hypothetical protein CHELA40_12203 [Chelatococcus asaccharovorans]
MRGGQCVCLGPTAASLPLRAKAAPVDALQRDRPCQRPETQVPLGSKWSYADFGGVVQLLQPGQRDPPEACGVY